MKGICNGCGGVIGRDCYNPVECEEISRQPYYNQQYPNIVDLEAERLEWSLDTFTEATPQSSLEKLKEEIREIEANIENGIKDPIEYADAMMCLFDSAGRDGMSLPVLIEAFEQKLAINKARKWDKNPDNTYSHQKQKQ